MTLAEIEPLVILRSVVGSTVHGVNVQDGIEDRDEMGIAIEPIASALSLAGEFEQIIHRTAAIREGKHDARSMAGDLDLCIYSLRKYLRLALKGNPTILVLLFVRGDAIVRMDARGAHLQELAPKIISRRAGGAFLGYMQAQRQRMMGERGSLKVHRPELVEQYGFDTKYAMHMCRLGIQGCELMRTGRVTLPMPEPERQWLRDLRLGLVSEQEALTRSGEWERELKDSWEQSPLPRDPDTAAVEQWMCSMYLENWKARDADARLLAGRR